MARKKWILSLTVFVAIAQQIHAGCVCNAKGENPCGCSGVIRPLPKHPKRPHLQLPPAGDSCWCSKTLIEPASLPKPCAKSQYDSPKCIDPRFAHTSSYTVPQANYVKDLVKDNSPPADPISVSLAAQADKAIEVPEAKLAYGFVRKPINGLPRVYISSIKEEDLYALANDVITLKKPTAPRAKNIEEDYPEPEEDEEEPAPDDYQPRSLTYKQLGYEAEQFKNPEFIKMPSYNVEGEGSLVEYKSKGDCGFKPGRIAKMKHTHKVNPIHYLLKY